MREQLQSMGFLPSAASSPSSSPPAPQQTDQRNHDDETVFSRATCGSDDGKGLRAGPNSAHADAIQASLQTEVKLDGDD